MRDSLVILLEVFGLLALVAGVFVLAGLGAALIAAGSACVLVARGLSA